MTLTRRERQRAATIDEIKQIARQQMADKGAAALSLRAIAREMGMTSPALYRYFASRDDLVTALIVDAYNSFADTLMSAPEIYPQDDHAKRVAAIADAYRQWALSHSQEYTLIFGTPIPHYQAPMEVTGPAAGRSMLALIKELDSAYQAGKFNTWEPSPALQEQMKYWIEKGGQEIPAAVVHAALGCWALIHGLVSLELYGHLSPDSDPGSTGLFFEAEVEATIKRLGLE